MRATDVVTLDLNELARGHTIRIRAVGTRVLGARCRLLSIALRIADLVAPCALELVADEPPAETYDVAVEKHGSDLLLRIGDRAVRLDRRDARHVGGLLEAGWTGTHYAAPAYRQG